ncbi:ATP-binding cassette domain-containing protein [bacterium]|nr:ATP-binding cassette domain-containing protein [bacterium]
MIEVEYLTKYYGNIRAIENVTFRVEKGEVVGFLGPNGSGKTTTMRILTCFMPASNGRATVAGYDVFTQSLDVRRHIGYMPESVPLYTEMKVSSYLKYVSKIRKIPRGQRNSRIDAVLESCGLTHMRNRIIGQLSKGYRQRVGLAQALIHDPDVLILDEPTIGLDPKQIVEIRELIKEFGKEHTILLSTHILPEASMICGRIIVINNGSIAGSITLSDGRITSIQSSEGETTALGETEKLYVEAKTPVEDFIAQVSQIPNVINVQVAGQSADNYPRFYIDYELNMDIREELSSVIINNSWELLEIRPVEMTLEEVFLRLTTE